MSGDSENPHHVFSTQLGKWRAHQLGFLKGVNSNQVLADKIKRIESFLTNLINQQRGGVNIRV